MRQEQNNTQHNEHTHDGIEFLALATISITKHGEDVLHNIHKSYIV